MKKWPIIKNSHFLFDPYSKFHEDLIENIDFLLMADRLKRLFFHQTLLAYNNAKLMSFFLYPIFPDADCKEMMCGELCKTVKIQKEFIILIQKLGNFLLPRLF